MRQSTKAAFLPMLAALLLISTACADQQEKLHALLLAELRASDEIEWSRAVADSSHVQAKKGAPRRGRARLIEPEKAPSITFSSTPPGSRLPGRSPAATATT